MPSGAGGALSAGTQVLTNRYDNLRSGTNTRETVLNPGNVNGSAFGLLFSRPIDGNAYAQPLYVSDLDIGGRKRNVVFVATSTNHLYAFDADDPAASMPLWSRWLAPDRRGADRRPQPQHRCRGRPGAGTCSRSSASPARRSSMRRPGSCTW